MNTHIKAYHTALNSGFPHLAKAIALMFQQQYGCNIDDAYASMLRNGTAYNSPAFQADCSPKGAYGEV